MSLRRPLIGITPDIQHTAERPGRPSREQLCLARSYADAVEKAGGIPVVLPLVTDDTLESVLSRIDGWVISGGAFDIDPAEYGATLAGAGPSKPGRTRFERALVTRALERGVPVLGICGGMQLLNVVLGGTLIQHIPHEVPGALPHEQAHDPVLPGHPVRVIPGTRLSRITGVDTLDVNSTHHQAVARIAADLQVSAVAPDGVVEAVEAHPAGRWAGRFVVGVQWHPESIDAAPHSALYAALAQAAAEGQS